MVASWVHQLPERFSVSAPDQSPDNLGRAGIFDHGIWAMAKLTSALLMERETRVAYGAVPTQLFAEPLEPMCWQMQPGEFLLRGDKDDYFFYRLGEGVTVQRGADVDTSEESLWLNGSVYAAVASMNGLLPIHASAVAVDGAIFAFTGAAGAGKSTLVAALGRYGLPMFCDDTLVLDLSDPEKVTCLPGHKRLKLRDDAFELTGAAREEQVSKAYEKHYAAPPAGIVDIALPIGGLIFLEEGDEPRIERISGSERFKKVEDNHYTFRIFEAASQFTRAEQFAHRARLARQIPMAQFERPLDLMRFEDGVSFIADYIGSRSRMSA
jgi:hypothetical protein